MKTARQLMKEETRRIFDRFNAISIEKNRGAKYKVLLISDIHCSNRLPQAKAGINGVTDRLADQLGLFARVREAVVIHECDEVFILGDLFDQSRVDAITLTEVTSAITAFSVPVRILAGNHDAVSTKGGRFTVEAFGKMGNENVHYMKTDRVYRPFKTSKESLGWLSFHPVAYCPQEEAERLIEKAAGKARNLDDVTTDVLLMHHSILGAKHNDWTCDDGLDASTFCGQFDAAFSGHFHTTATFGPKENGMYLGAPLHLRVEDEGRLAGYWIVTFFENGEIEREFVDGGCPRFHTVEWPTSMQQIREDKLAKVGDYLRVIVHATQSEWERVKPEVEALVLAGKATNLRMGFKHKPIYHHTLRTVDEKGDAVITSAARPEQAVESYVDSEDVDTEGLDKMILKRIGREALDNVRSSL